MKMISLTRLNWNTRLPEKEPLYVNADQILYFYRQTLPAMSIKGQIPGPPYERPEVTTTLMALEGYTFNVAQTPEEIEDLIK